MDKEILQKRYDNTLKLRDGYLIELQQDEKLLNKCSKKDRPNILWRVRNKKKTIKELENKMNEIMQEIREELCHLH